MAGLNQVSVSISISRLLECIMSLIIVDLCTADWAFMVPKRIPFALVVPLTEGVVGGPGFDSIPPSSSYIAEIRELFE